MTGETHRRGVRRGKSRDLEQSTNISPRNQLCYNGDKANSSAALAAEPNHLFGGGAGWTDQALPLPSCPTMPVAVELSSLPLSLVCNKNFLYAEIEQAGFDVLEVDVRIFPCTCGKGQASCDEQYGPSATFSASRSSQSA